MTWVRLDDHMVEHPKVLSLAAPLTVLVTALQVRALSYASRHLTDGFLASEAVPALLHGFEELELAPPRHTEAMCVNTPNGRDFDWPSIMVEAGLWEKRKRGYMIHDYLDYNPSRAQVLATRTANRERQQRVRNRHAVTNGDVTDPSQVPPAPTPTTTTTTTGKGEPDDSVTNGVTPWEHYAANDWKGRIKPDKAREWFAMAGFPSAAIPTDGYANVHGFLKSLERRQREAKKP